MREIDLCKENPKLFEPSSDLITPEEYEKMPPEVRAKVLSMPPGARHLALPPLPVDFEAVCKALIPKLEAIPQVESLWIYEDNPITPSFWWVDAHLALLGRHPVTHIARNADVRDYLPAIHADYMLLYEFSREARYRAGRYQRWRARYESALRYEFASIRAYFGS